MDTPRSIGLCGALRIIARSPGSARGVCRLANASYSDWWCRMGPAAGCVMRADLAVLHGFLHPWPKRCSWLKKRLQRRVCSALMKNAPLMHQLSIIGVLTTAVESSMLRTTTARALLRYLVFPRNSISPLAVVPDAQPRDRTPRKPRVERRCVESN